MEAGDSDPSRDAEKVKVVPLGGLEPSRNGMVHGLISGPRLVDGKERWWFGT